MLSPTIYLRFPSCSGTCSSLRWCGVKAEDHKHLHTSFFLGYSCSRTSCGMNKSKNLGFYRPCLSS
jgi:hypothetical protein